MRGLPENMRMTTLFVEGHGHRDFTATGSPFSIAGGISTLQCIDGGLAKNGGPEITFVPTQNRRD